LPRATPPMGWVGIALVTFWLAVGGCSSTAVHAIKGPLPFVAFVPLLVFVVERARRLGNGEDLFARVGLIGLYSWLTVAFSNAFSMNWGDDPFLLQIVETFHHSTGAIHFALVFAIIAGAWAIGEEGELHALGLLAVLTSAVFMVGIVEFVCIWFAIRLCKKTAQLKWSVGVGIVAFLALLPEVDGSLCSWGASWGSAPFVPVIDVLWSSGAGQLPLIVTAVLALMMAGLLLKIGHPRIAIGLVVTSILLLRYLGSMIALGGCGDVILTGAQILLIVACAGPPKTEVLLWGTASFVLPMTIYLVRYDWNQTWVLCQLSTAFFAGVSVALSRRLPS